MIAKAQPHLAEALPWLPVTKSGQRYFQLVSSDALEEMSCPYWKPPCGSLAAPQSHTAAPLLLSFPSPGADKSPSGKRGDAKDNARWGLGWISTPVPQEPSLLTKDAASSLLAAQGCRRDRAAVAAPLVLPTELTPDPLLPSRGSRRTCCPPLRGMQPPRCNTRAQAGPKGLAGLSIGSASSGSAPEGPGFR